ncbi:Vacuolar protein sorting-associated protein 51 [Mortierella alpina]|nr:Vacuolar protein sorting-associated protein 51 [Mortierella alpina]
MATAGDRIIHQLDAALPAATRPRPARSGTGSSTGAGAAPGAGTASGTTAAGTTATRRRAKSFLRNYYGIQHTDSSQQDGSKENASAQAGPVSKSDPYDLDSHAFEVDKYMHKMFVEKQLPGLIQADNELVADIRQLDGDMKTLVYENYSKFLSATDTINKMKSNVDNLESEMSRLTQNIGRIATSSSAIHSSLGSKREKIRQLNGVHSLLTKLQFVFELPTNLHQCLETESYTQAVRSYCRTLHLLQHFKHLTVFTGIERECKIIMVQVAQRIRQKMCADMATISDILECVGLLLALKEEPVALWKQCLELSMKCLKRVKVETLENIKSLPLYVPPMTTSPKVAQTPSSSTSKKARKAARTPSSPGPAAASSATPRDKSSLKGSLPPPGDKVSCLNAQFLKQVESLVVSFRNYFLTPAPGSAGSAGVVATANDEAGTNGDHRAPAWIAKDARVYASLTAEQQAEASMSVKDTASKLISQYLDIISSFLDYPDDILKIQPEVHVHVLQNLYLGTTASAGLCQLVGFDALATGLIQNWETRLIEKALGKVKEDLLTRIMEQGNPDITSSGSPNLSGIRGDTGDMDMAAEGASDRKNSSSTPPPRPGLTAMLKRTAEWLLDIFKMDTIPFLEKCMSSDAQFLETPEGRALFLRNFQDGFRAFWDQILKEMQQRSCLVSATSSAGSRTCSLVMSRLCFELSNSVVEQLYKSVSKTLYRPGKRNRSGSFLIESYDEPPVIPQLQWDCKAVIQSCQESGHALLDGFIFRTGNELSSKLVSDVSTLPSVQRQQLATTAQSSSGVLLDAMSQESPPKKVSDPWEQIYRQLNEIERQVVVAYGDEGDDRQGNHEISSESTRRESAFRATTITGGGGGSHNGNTNNSRLSHRNDSLTSFGSNTMNSRFENQQRNLLLTNIDKLFSDRVEIFVRCQDLNRTGIMFGIIKILLKAWAEAVRMKTFSRGGFQQVQIDAEFAKVWLWRFATADERLMHSLLEETQQTAYRRCIDAVPLDMNTVESIINSSER